MKMEDDIDHDNEDEKNGSKIEKGEAWQDVKIASNGFERCTEKGPTDYL